MPVTETINPRHLREKFADWKGKRVVVGTHSYHYLCGVWKEIAGAEVLFEIGGRAMRVPLADVATVADADPWQADFFK